VFKFIAIATTLFLQAQEQATAPTTEAAKAAEAPKIQKFSQLCQRALTEKLNEGDTGALDASCHDYVREAVDGKSFVAIDRAADVILAILGEEKYRNITDLGWPLKTLAQTYQNSTPEKLTGFFDKLEKIIFPDGKLRPATAYSATLTNMVPASIILLEYYNTSELTGEKMKALVEFDPLFEARKTTHKPEYVANGLTRVKAFITLGRYADARRVLNNYGPFEYPLPMKLTADHCRLYVQEGEILYAEGKLKEAIEKMKALTPWIKNMRGEILDCLFDAEFQIAFSKVMLGAPDSKEAIGVVEGVPVPYAKEMAKHIFTRYYRRMKDPIAMSLANSIVINSSKAAQIQYRYYSQREKMLTAINLNDKKNYNEARLELNKLWQAPRPHAKNMIFIRTVMTIGDAMVLGAPFDKASFESNISQVEKFMGQSHPMVKDLRDLASQIKPKSN